MKADKTANDTDLSSIPGEFRENYRFLSELINCKHKNSAATEGLEGLVHHRLSQVRGHLNRRQLKILHEFLQCPPDYEAEALAPPVPAELEASIRVKRRSKWLPWEAEAIRKIERWRADILCITGYWTGIAQPPDNTVTLKREAGKTGSI